MHAKNNSSLSADSSDGFSDLRSLRDFAEISSDWFWEQDEQFRFKRFFGNSIAKLKRNPDDFIGKRRWDMPLRGISPQQLQAHIELNERHEPFRNLEYEMLADDGSVQYYAISGVPVFDEHGEFSGYRGTARNVTDIRLADLEIKNNERKLSQILNASTIPTLVIDLNHRVTHWNQACANITHIGADQMIGADSVWRAFYSAPRPALADLVLDGASDEEITKYYGDCRHSSLVGDGVETVHYFPEMSQDGDQGLWLFITAAPLRDSNGGLTGAIETLQNVTRQVKAKDALEQLANRDGLTGVANRRTFDVTLAKEWKRAQRDGLPLSLLMIDVDHFKRYNDSYGHQKGDSCLQLIAGLLQNTVGRPSDLVSRYGGEEFAIILTATDEEGAAAVARQILAAILEIKLAHTGSPTGFLSLSIGGATVNAGVAEINAGSLEMQTHAAGSDALIASADLALYHAKDSGRAQYIASQFNFSIPHKPVKACQAPESADYPLTSQVKALRNFAEMSSDWFWEQDAEFRFTRFFGRTTEKLRRNQSDFIGRRRWDMPIHGVSNEQLRAHIAQHERHEAFQDFEYLIPSDDGETQYFSISGAPIFNEKGEFIGYHGVGRNITDLRMAEFAIRERERQLAEIVNGSPIPTFVLDSQHKVTHWNQACAAITGLPPEKMLQSQEAWRAFYQEARPTLANMVLAEEPDEVIAKNFLNCSKSPLIADAWEVESYFSNLGKDGLWLHFTAAPLRDSSGKIMGAIETLQDITVRRRAEEMLQDQAQSLLKSRDELELRVKERTQELSQQYHFMRQLIDAIPSPLFFKDRNLRYLGCNSAFLEFSGRHTQDIIGKTVYELSPFELAQSYEDVDRELLKNRGSKIYESQVRYPSGEMKDVIFHKASYTHADGSVGGIVALIIDISDRKRLEKKLRQAATVFDSSLEGITIANPDGSIIAVNRAFTRITGFEEIEVIGNNPRILQSGRHDKSFYQKMWATIGKEGRWEGEIWNRRKSGELYPEWISIAAVRDKKGELTNYIATFTDVTQHKHNEEKIQRLAFSDPLTGLPNRRLLLDRLQHALAASARSHRYGALFFIDIDDFKGINDTQGHEIGDLMLQQVGQRLADCVRPGDTVARLSGDEFVVMIEDLADHAEEGTALAEIVGSKVLETLKHPYSLHTYLHHTTASIGITLFVEQQSSLEEILKQADLALHRAKSAGRGTLREAVQNTFRQCQIG